MAIAFDAATDSSVTGTSLTFSHTCTGSDRVLFVAMQYVSNTITGVTYNGVSMTLEVQRNGTNRAAIYSLINPATGANNVVVSSSSSQQMQACAMSYTGANQTPADLIKATVDRAATGTSDIQTVTTTVNGCWQIGTCGIQRPTTASTGATERQSGNIWGSSFADSNGSFVAGNNSMTFTYASITQDSIGLAFAPVAAANTGSFFAFF